MNAYDVLRKAGLSGLLRAVYRIEIVDGGRIPASGGCILAANHESLVDPFILGTVTTRPIHYVAKSELFRRRLPAKLLRSLGAIPLARGTGDTRAMDEARRTLERGEVVGMFPQGTCLPYERRPFLRGAARLALVTGVPLVPVCLVGTERALRPHRVRIGLPRITILVGEPIQVEPQKPTSPAAKELTARVENAIAELRRPYGEPAHVWITA